MLSKCPLNSDLPLQHSCSWLLYLEYNNKEKPGWHYVCLADWVVLMTDHPVCCGQRLGSSRKEKMMQTSVTSKEHSIVEQSFCCVLIWLIFQYHYKMLDINKGENVIIAYGSRGSLKQRGLVRTETHMNDSQDARHQCAPGVQLSPSYLVYGWLSPPFRVDLPPSVSSVWQQHQRQDQIWASI